MAVIHGQKDSPTLDLNFSRNKSLVDTMTGRNLIDFSRTSSGTYVDSKGLIKTSGDNEARFDHDPVTGESLGLLVEEARTNSWTYSEQPSQSPWTQTNITVTENNVTSPDGNLTGALLSSSSSGANYVYQTHVENLPTFTIYAKAGTTSNLWVRLQSSVVGRNVAYNFNLSDGTFSAATGNTGNLTGWTERKSITNAGNGWYRIEVGFASSTNTVTTDYQISPSIDGSAGASGETVYIWGAQLEYDRTFPTSYIPTPATFTSRASTATYYDSNGVIQTAGIDVARDNAYFPDENGVMRPAGLLLEGSATNLYPYSETPGSWSVANNATISTDGTTIAGMTAYKVTSNISTNALFLAGSATLTANTTYTSSVYHKPGNVDGFWFEARFYTGGGTPKIYFDSSTETWSATSGGTWSVRSEKIESNAWRHSITFYIDTDTSGSIRMGGLGPANTTNVSAGDYGYLAAPQIEASSYPTSYIPTAGSTVTRAADISSSSTVTRAADVAQITGSNFSSWYNQSEGSLLTDFISRGRGSSNVAYSALVSGNGGFSNLFGTAIGGAGSGVFTPYVYVSSNSVYWQSSASPSFPNASRVKLGLAAKSADMAFAVNGLNPATNSSQLMPVGPNQLSLSAYPINGHLSRLTYYPVRLSNAILQNLTK